MPTWLVLVVLALVLVLQPSCARMVGLTPRASARWARWAGPVSWTALVAGFLAIGFDPWWFVGLLTAGVLVHGAVPVVRWRRAVRRGASSECRWPRGAEAFAILSILARADSVAPDRLSAIAGLEPAAGERWLHRLRSERSSSGGRRRHRLIGDERVGLTVPGRERLERMRADLERLAGQVPVG